MSKKSRTQREHRATKRAQKRSTKKHPVGKTSAQTPKRSPWRIIGVFDPDHTGQDFAYTVGLADLGFPELHMWARPTDGSDPGADFFLSQRDLRSFLNRYAELLQRGELDIGSEFADPLDAGMTEARVTVGSPVHPDDVEAFGVRSGAKVLPLRWELRREPEGTSSPVLPGVAQQIERLAVEWRRLVAELEGSSVPTRPIPPNTDHTQRFGPWTPAIEQMRRALAIVGAMGELSWCIDALAERSGEISESIALAAALARRHGRSRCFAAAKSAAEADAKAAISRDDSIWEDMSDEEIDYLLPDARHHMKLILAACYANVVVLEHLDQCPEEKAELSALVHGVVFAVVRQAADPTGTAWFGADWPDEGLVDTADSDEEWPDAG